MKPCKYGHWSKRGTQNECLECRRLYARKYRTENPDAAKTNGRAYYAANRERRTEAGRRYYSINFKKTMLQNAQKRARLGGYPCTITEADIVVPEFCPLLGIKLENGGDRATSPSLDKIVPSLGYVRGNVWVISWRANTIKNDASLRELETLVDNLKKRCTDTYAPKAVEPQSLVMPWTFTAPTTARMPWQ